MAGTRKIAAILVADVVGYSRLAGAVEGRILARLRAAQQSDWSRRRRTSRVDGQAHRRWAHRRISQRGRRRALRYLNCSAA